MSQPFMIRIENQRFLENHDEDLCSHGEIYLSVNGTILTKAGIDEEWGISESALALLRTLFTDHQSDIEFGEGLIVHGCGAILMVNCPISIHWTVKHLKNRVILSNFIKVTTTNSETGSIYYPELKVDISWQEYKDQLVSFALEAKDFFQDITTKRFADEYDKEMYEEFWNEYLLLLKRVHN
ncbi:hypothetical protein [Neobacillus sp. D3-1R]|uniref:hypothetical protein n=1 Tax=Neobacillus sp. D3-1R TaxID=3445778 RepID=UPI003FA1790E